MVLRKLLALGTAVLLSVGVASAQCKPGAAGCAPAEKKAAPAAAAKKDAGCNPAMEKKMAAEKKAAAKTKTLVGVVSDTACGRKHTMMPGKSDAECTKGCIKMGSKYALVVGKKVYTLEGQEAELDKLAGEKAKVTGNVSESTVKVSSVTKG